VTLYAKRALSDSAQLISAVSHQYGVKLEGVKLKTFYSRHPFADAWRIAMLAIKAALRADSEDLFLSRNLYASFVIGHLFRRPILFETHQLEIGFRKKIQKWIMTRPWITTVVISSQLVECLREHHGVSPFKTAVLHDAAPEGIKPISPEDRNQKLKILLGEDLSRWQAVFGYFGHLYSGRGIEIIESIAALRPKILFLVFGGNETQIRERRAANEFPNLKYMGHVPHSTAREFMLSMDGLLMPYQEKVSIGIKGHDTAKWMSPMKMFEYMATGVPIISSDLPVLREVLKPNVNCLMAVPSDTHQWVKAVDTLVTNRELAGKLGREAHSDYLAEYTWAKRAEAILKLARDEK
jgi:glycosyltransferase involved in cell wall biosynthesis